MPDIATLFAWFVIAALFSVFVAAIVGLGSLPGKIARGRNHPHAAAINAASWLGLAMGGIPWAVAFVWAFIPFGDSQTGGTPKDGELQRLRDEVADLQSQLATIRQSGGQHS